MSREASIRELDVGYVTDVPNGALRREEAHASLAEALGALAHAMSGFPSGRSLFVTAMGCVLREIEESRSARHGTQIC
jgi:hypothetical protein